MYVLIVGRSSQKSDLTVHEKTHTEQKSMDVLDRKKMWHLLYCRIASYAANYFFFFCKDFVFIYLRGWGGGVGEGQADSVLSLEPIARLDLRTLRSLPGLKLTEPPNHPILKYF